MGVLFKPFVVWALFATGFVGALIVVVVPPVTLSSVHSWDAMRGEQVVTGLVRPVAESVTVVGSCGVGGGANSDVLQADNWLVSVRGQDLEVVSPRHGDVIISSVLPGSCGFEVAYSLTDMAVTVTVVDDSTGVVISQESAVVPEAFRVSGFGVSGAGEPVFDQVVVETFPWGLGFSPVRFVGQVLVFGAVGLLVLRTALRDRASPSPVGEAEVFPRVGSRWSRWVVHGSVLVFLVGGMLLFPSHFDDGWVFHRVSGSVTSGVQSDLYLEGFWLVQLIWLEKSMAALVSLGAGFLSLKFLFAVVAWLGWLLAMRAISMMGYIVPTPLLAVFASVFVAFSLAFLVTIRAEPVVVVLVAVFFVGFIGFVKQLREGYLLLAGLAAVATGTAHQSGFVLIFPALLLVGFAVWQGVSGRVRLGPVGVSVGASVLFGFGLALLDYDLRTLLQEARTPLNLTDYVAPEWSRWAMLFAEPGWAWFPLLLAAIVLIFILSGFNRLGATQKWVVIAIGSAPVGLYFSLSKWPVHLSVLAVPVLLLIAIALDKFREIGTLPRNPWPTVALFSVAGAASVLAINAEAIRHWVYPYRELSSGLIQEILPGSWFGVLLLVVPLLGVVGYLGSVLPGRVSSSVMSLTLVGVILAPVSNHYGMLVADSAIYKGWSPIKQRVMDISGAQNCGLLDDVSIVVGTDQVGSARNKEKVDVRSPFGVDAYLLEKVEESVRFELSRESESLAFWVRPLQRNAEALVELSDGQGGTRYIRVDNFDDEMWRIVSVPQPSRWASIEVRPVAQPRDFGGLLVSALSEPELESPKRAVSGSAIFSGPIVNTYIPCAHEPSSIDGVWEVSQYLLRNDWGWPIGSEGIYGDFVEVAYRDGVRGSFISLVKVVSE